MAKRTSILTLILVSFAARGCAAADAIHISIAPGVQLVQETIPPPAGPLFINVLRVDLKKPGIRIEVGKSRDSVWTEDPLNGRETVGSLARRKGAVAAVNADFFPFTGDPLGIAIRNGELISESMPNRAAMGITTDGKALFDNLLAVGTLTGTDGSPGALDGINRPIGNDEIILLTPVWGARTATSKNATMVVLDDLSLPVRVGTEVSGRAESPVPADPRLAISGNGGVLIASGSGADWLKAHVKEGESVRLRFDLASTPAQPGPARGRLAARAAPYRGRIAMSSWTDVKEAVGGGPWLVRDGKVAVDGEEEGFPVEEFVTKRHPRTAAGITASGELLLLTVDGRQPHSRGMSLPELADYMVKQGAVQAINLDGGGSTTMVVDNLYVNAPSDHEPRAVADALLVFVDGYTPPTLMPANAPALSIPAGGSATIQVAGNAPESPLFGTLEGTAYVDSRGVISGARLGSGTVVALGGSTAVTFPFTVQAGPPARIRASLIPAPNNPPDRNLLVITVLDAYGNPAANQTVGIKAVGGTPETPSGTTDSKGRVTVEIVWDVQSGRRATASCGSLSTVTIVGK